jgi:hypothetical protein
MNKALATAVLLLATPAAAQTIPVTDGDLTAAYSDCKMHFTMDGGIRWNPGWEHCATIAAEINKRAVTTPQLPANTLSESVAKRLKQ